ncbi:uncharacterized protein LACBIDRAFT_303650 [Laccaria bicolor S238N-H82]|uniref:Predicted protein n=1 Tax=Laccaria bicolor (strain S238N-H82 / ATCC MYA-4686) TaxID=486041 RepID=B0E485_LACBS|nr:uncharacterized protein LACBIDRAFT_303650 [Laccaria bicolor S238N-H82]EDQ98349.1 predicted protein [Laccaria bicolor S238N-H82]|eukprot:XP_001891005.1 predicted protein [Laccaria bicolor S238N-H82]
MKNRPAATLSLPMPQKVIELQFIEPISGKNCWTPFPSERLAVCNISGRRKVFKVIKASRGCSETRTQIHANDFKIAVSTGFHLHL